MIGAAAIQKKKKEKRVAEEKESVTNFVKSNNFAESAEISLIVRS